MSKMQEKIDKTITELDKIDGILDFCVQSLYKESDIADKTNLIYILEMLQEKITTTKINLEEEKI